MPKKIVANLAPKHRRLALVHGREYEVVSEQTYETFRSVLFDRDRLWFTRPGVRITVDHVRYVRERVDPSRTSPMWFPIDRVTLCKRADERAVKVSLREATPDAELVDASEVKRIEKYRKPNPHAARVAAMFLFEPSRTRTARQLASALQLENRVTHRAMGVLRVHRVLDIELPDDAGDAPRSRMYDVPYALARLA